MTSTFYMLTHIVAGAGSLPRYDVTAEGEKESVRLMIDGTREDGVLGIAPTGRTIEVAVLDLFEIRNDTLAEHRALPDNRGMLRQLGVPSI